MNKDQPKSIDCYLCDAKGFKSGHSLGAHLRNHHPGQSRTSKEKKRLRKKSDARVIDALTVIEQPNRPAVESPKFCPECGHCLIPYVAAIQAMKGRT